MTYNAFDNIRALALVEQTNDAYSFDRYGEKVWFDICRFMLKEGLNNEQVHAILRSKHMRWAADRSNASFNEFRKYYHFCGNSNTGPGWVRQFLINNNLMGYNEEYR